MELDVSEIGALLGEELAWSRDVSAPRADVKTSVSQCLSADSVGTLSDYGEDWTTFRKTTAQVAEDDDSKQVVLVVGLYPTEAKARGQFDGIVTAVRACDGKAVTETDTEDAESTLTFHMDPIGADSIQWRSERTAPAQRSCSYDTRARRNALLQALVCSKDAPSPGERTGAKMVADALEAKLQK